MAFIVLYSDTIVKHSTNGVAIIPQINPRPAGGGGGGAFFERPLRFFEDSENTAFHPPCPHVFRTFCENFDPRSYKVRSPGQVKWPNFKITPIAPRLQSFRESYETFGIWWGHQCLKNVYLGFLISVTSGQVIFATSPIPSQWAKINSVIFTLAQAYLSEIISYGTVVDKSSKNLHCLPLERSFEVTRGHQPSFANIFLSKRDRDVGLVSVRSYRPGESTDMQHDPFQSSCDLGLTWPEVKLWHWPFKVIVYMVRRALTRQTRWYQNRCSISNIKGFVVENPFWKILEFWPLETSILTWAKKWPKWFRNDFSQAFERCLLFFSKATRSRDHGGGGVQTPPSRRWKIQRPSRARVNKSGVMHGLQVQEKHCLLLLTSFTCISNIMH